MVDEVNTSRVDWSADNLTWLDGERCYIDTHWGEDAYRSSSLAMRLDNDLALRSEDAETIREIT